MKSRFDYPHPAGRKLLHMFPVRRGALRDPQFPYEHVVAEPAIWPAAPGARMWLARPIRAVRAAFMWAAGRLHRLVEVVEGQPLVWTVVMEGWVEWHVMRDGRLRTWFEYHGEITPAIRQMYAEHPERFADSPDALKVLEARQ